MYHLELRQFPHNFCRFNLTERELREMVLLAWARGDWVEVGERKWNPQQASLTVLEGPEMPLAQLSMGRGWRNATRKGQDVTESLLTSARTGSEQALAAPAGPAEEAGPAGPAEEAGMARLAADSLGLEVLARLANDLVPVALAWRVARERYPERSAGGCLQLAESAVGSLAGGGLVELLAEGADGPKPISPEAIGTALSEIDSWGETPSSGSLSMRWARAPSPPTHR